MDGFEEIADELNRDSHKIGKIIFIFFLLIAILFIIFLGIEYIREKEKKDEKIEEQEIQSTDFDCYDVCEYDFKVKNKNIKVKYEKQLDSNMHKISINNHVILEEELECGGPLKLVVLENTFILHYRSGCIDTLDKLIAYDKDGNQLFAYGTIDEENSDLELRNTVFTIKDNKITFRVTSMKNNTTLSLEGKDYNLCNETELLNDNIDDSKIVEATYDIVYDGNLQFQLPKKKKSVTLGKYKKLHEIDTICKKEVEE